MPKYNNNDIKVHIYSYMTVNTAKLIQHINFEGEETRKKKFPRCGIRERRSRKGGHQLLYLDFRHVGRLANYMRMNRVRGPAFESAVDTRLHWAAVGAQLADETKQREE